MSSHRSFRIGPILAGAIFALAASGAIVPAAATAQDMGPSAQPIGAADLLRSQPFDRITLIDNTVLIVDPVSPRPLPVIDPKKERERRRQGGGRTEAAPIEVGVEAPKAQAKDPNAEALESIKIHLLAGNRNEVRDFQVKRSSIKKIEYFEDLLLEESARLLLARDFNRAFECCLRVRTRSATWAGLDESVNRCLFVEGRRALVDGDDERGLRLLRELLGRKRDYPGLLEQIAQAYGKRIERALRMERYALGRRVLHELEEVVGDLPAVKELRGLFVARAAERARQGESAGPAGRLDALVEALRIWPDLPGADERYNQAFQAEPTLDVGVTDVPSPPGPWLHSRADVRVNRLLYRPILEADDEESRRGKRPGQLAAEIETSDLGHRLIIRLRPGPTWSDGSRPVSAIDVAHSLIERSDPHSPTYEARWADLLDRVQVRDESRIEVRLNHSPLKAGGWLLGPVGPAHAGIDGCVAISARERLLVTDGTYMALRSTADSLELRLRDDAGPSPSSSAPDTPPHVRRIREVRLSRGLAAVTALRRGEVALIDHVPPDQVESLAQTPDIQVGQYTMPVIHAIALDGRNPALRNRALRRGLSNAIDRKGLLEETILKHPITEVDAPADGPFPRGSYADAPGVKPLGFNIMLAKMLVAAARKEMGGAAIKLTFEYPAIPECRAASLKMAEAFRIAGVEIETVEVPESRLERELRAGRRFDLAYRVMRCQDPVLEAGPLLCPAYDAPPETDPLTSAASTELLRLLLQLEQSGEWATARALAIQIDRETRHELGIIPLWQLADHYAWRSRLTGPGPTADDLYHGLEGWRISPWFARDPWSTPRGDRPK